MNSRTDPILAQWRVILVSSTDNSIQLEQFINANMAKCQCVVKGIWAFSLFFPREIDSFALELCFIVDFVCQIVFRKMGNKFPFDVTAKNDGDPPPPPPLYHPCRSPWRVLTAFWIILYPRACVTLIHRNGDLTNTSTANLVPRVFGLFGQRDNAAQKARKRSGDDPKTTRRLYSAKNRSCGYGIRDCERLRAVRNDIHSDGSGFPLSVIFWEKIVLELNP